MADTSAILGLPYLSPSQAQKHVTHNEALALLDLLVQLRVEGLDTGTPPLAPLEGEIWGLGVAPTGAWAGQAGKLAAFVGGAWMFLAPVPGWRAWDKSAGELRVWDGIAWSLPGAATQNLSSLGIATTADAVNRLAVRAAAALFTHDGAGHRIKVNKAGSGETASLLFQSAFTGHAEMGLAGSDDFALKVSPDGSAWTTALAADAATGTIGFPAGLTLMGGTQVLDAYDRGAWTPEIADAATGGTAGTATTAAGRYTRIGEHLHLSFVLEGIDTTGLSGTNALHIRGLPFPVKSASASCVTAVPKVSRVTSATPPYLYATGGESALRLMRTVSGGVPVALTVSTLTSGTAEISGSLSYRV